jgi:MFS family permease
VLFGLLMPVIPTFIAFSTDNFVIFVVASFFAQLLSSSALGAAAASSQSLVLPRMRGTATATFLLSTTLVGLALGPFTAGYISASNNDDLALGVISTLASLPVGLVLLISAIRLYPAAQAGITSRARAAGEKI